MGYLLTVYLEDYIILTRKVTGIGDFRADGYSFRNINLRRSYAQVTGRK